MKNNFTFLYVEDDPKAQEGLKMILEDDVKEFFQASNGIEGFEIYKRERPDIILTDINMPIMDGITMVKAIKEVDPSQPILMLSAFDDQKTLLEAINIGIDGFLPKPINVATLLQKLNQVSKNLQEKYAKEELTKQKIEHLHDLAYYDSLTNLPNRFFFNIRLEEALQKAKKENGKITLFFIDLDGFKNINDNYGHAAGDTILRSVAKNIQNIIREKDTFARISGDEFALIVEGMHEQNYINKLAQRVLDAIAEKINFDGDTIGVTCSIGISQYPNDCTTKDSLLRLADKAMYKAKEDGKSQYRYSHTQTGEIK